MCLAKKLSRFISVKKLHNALGRFGNVKCLSSVSLEVYPNFFSKNSLQKHCCHKFYCGNVSKQYFYSTQTEELVDSNTFERVCDETLDSLAEYFEELIEKESQFVKADVMYSGGVLTIDLSNYGTYVINRQSPNRQIWLSSPSSGPKRYDYSQKDDCWIYRHNGTTLHNLIKLEIEGILGKSIDDILVCPHAKQIRQKE